MVVAVVIIWLASVAGSSGGEDDHSHFTGLSIDSLSVFLPAAAVTQKGTPAPAPPVVWQIIAAVVLEVAATCVVLCIC